MMNYLQWNNLIGDIIFRQSSAGKMISLMVSTDDLINQCNTSGCFPVETSGEVIVADFKKAWCTGFPLKVNPPGLVDKINAESLFGHGFHKRNQIFYVKINDVQFTINYPPELTHLAGILIALIESTESSRYHRIISFFDLPSKFFPSMSERLNWNDSWDRLVWWANEYKKGSLGILPARSLSSQNFAYMGKPFAHLLMSARQISAFYQYLFLADQEPDAEISDLALLGAYIRAVNKNEFSKILSSGKWSEDRDIILSILRAYYHNWSGEVRLEKDGTHRFYQSRKLRLCFSVNNRTGYAEFSFRFRENLLNDSGIMLDGAVVEIFPNQWSSPIKFNNEFSKQIFQDEQNGLKVVFSPNDESVFVFSTGRAEGLDASVMLEVGQISPSGYQYLLMTRALMNELALWIEINNGIDESEELLDDGLSVNWALFRFADGFFQPFENGITKLSFSKESSFSYIEGLPGKEKGEFICGHAISAVLNGATGDEKLLLRGLKEDYIIDLSAGLVFQVPASLPCDTYFVSIWPQKPNLVIPHSGKLNIVSPHPGTGFNEWTENPSKPQYVCQEEKDNNSMARDLLKNKGLSFSPPPQFDYWKSDEVLLSNLPEAVMDSLSLMEYVSYVSQTDKNGFEHALYQIFSRKAGVEQHKKFTRNTLNAMKESSRIFFKYDAKGQVNSYQAVPPFIIQLGNFQNFQIPSLTGMKAFEGSLYAFGGCLTLSILTKINGICKLRNAEMRIFEEKSVDSLMPPSVYLYAKRGSDVLEEVLKFLNQQYCPENYEYMTGLPDFKTRLSSFLEADDYNLHIAQRFKPFDLVTYNFQPAKANEEMAYPSLALYQVEPWKWHYVLRMELNGTKFNRETEPRIGRFLLLNIKNINLVSYNKAENALIVPAYFRFPEEIERNLFFHTGRLPMTKYYRGYLNDGPRKTACLVYNGVLKKAAEKVAESLGQKLILLNSLS